MKRLFSLAMLAGSVVFSTLAAPQVIYSNQSHPGYTVPPPSAAPVGQPHLAQGYYTPFALGIFYPLQLPPGRVSVGGVRINLLYSECADMDGIDLGGLMNVVNGNARSLQIAPIAVNKCDGAGCQIGAVDIVNNSYDGIQIGVVDYARQMNGLQIGVYNGSDSFQGLQIGVVNYTRNCNGMQIGVVNVIENSELKFFPILNCHF